MAYTVRLITRPTTEPVSLESVKRHLAIEDDFTAYDDLITGLILNAVQVVEDYAQRGLVTQTLELVMDDWQGSCFELPMAGPLASITSIKWKDENGTVNTVDPSTYSADTDALPGRVVFSSVPSGMLFPSSAVRIRYVVGQQPEDIPQIFKTAITFHAGRMFEARGIESTDVCVEKIVHDLLRTHRLHSNVPLVRGI